MFSPPRAITVTDPSGPPSVLTLGAEDSFVLADSSTTLYCMLRDGTGNIVLTDTGTAIHLSAGVAGGTIAPAEVLTTHGIASAIYTAARLDSTIDVTASVIQATTQSRRATTSALTASVPLQCKTDALALEKAKANALIAQFYPPRLSGLRKIDPASWLYAYNDLSVASQFVRNTSDVYKLRRLNLFLQTALRVFRFDSPGAPPDREPQGGVAMMWIDFADSHSNIEMIRYGFVYDILQQAGRRVGGPKNTCWSWIPGYTNVVEWANRTLDEWLNGALTNPPRKLNQAHVPWLRRQQQNIRYGTQVALRGANIGAATLRAGILNPAWYLRYSTTASIASQMNNDVYGAALRADVADMIVRLSQETRDLSNDAASRSLVNKWLVRATSRSQVLHWNYKSYDAAFGGWLLNAVSCFPGGHAAKDFFSALPLLVAGAACGDQAFAMVDSMGYYERIAASPIGSFAAGTPARSLPSRVKSGAALTQTGYSRRVVEAEETGVEGFVQAARAVEIGLESSDAVQVAAAESQMTLAMPAVSDGIRGLLSIARSAFQDARLAVPGFQSSVDSLTTAAALADQERESAVSAVGDWLASAEDVSVRDTALAAIRSAVDASTATQSSVQAFLSSVLGSLSEPLIVPTVTSISGGDTIGTACRIEATVTNYGAGTAEGVAMTLTADSLQLLVIGDPRVVFGDLGPGESRTCSWVARPIMAPADSDSIAIVSFALVPDSSASLAVVASGAIRSMWVSGVLAVPHTQPLRETAFVQPNPSRGLAAVTVSLTRAGVIRLGVYDISGRALAPVEEHPGRVGVNTFAVSLSRLQPGAYFVRVQTSEHTWTKRIVRLR